MSAHLRYDAKTGKVESKTRFGEFTKDLLQLNDEATVRYRVMATHIVADYEAKLAEFDKQLRELDSYLRSGKATQDEYREIRALLDEQRALAVVVIDSHTGRQPLPNLAARHPAA